MLRNIKDTSKGKQDKFLMVSFLGIVLDLSINFSFIFLLYNYDRVHKTKQKTMIIKGRLRVTHLKEYIRGRVKDKLIEAPNKTLLY